MENNKKEMIQHNIKLEKELKDFIPIIAEFESEKRGVSINPSEMTRIMIREYIKKWREENNHESL